MNHTIVAGISFSEVGERLGVTIVLMRTNIDYKSIVGIFTKWANEDKDKPLLFATIRDVLNDNNVKIVAMRASEIDVCKVDTDLLVDNPATLLPWVSDEMGEVEDNAIRINFKYEEALFLGDQSLVIFPGAEHWSVKFDGRVPDEFISAYIAGKYYFATERIDHDTLTQMQED